MAHGKGHTRPCLQILLEPERATFIGERDGDVYAPWPVPGRMWATPGIVGREPRFEVAGDARVETRPGIGVLQDVDDAFRCFHAQSWSKRPAVLERTGFRQTTASG